MHVSNQICECILAGTYFSHKYSVAGSSKAWINGSLCSFECAVVCSGESLGVLVCFVLHCGIFLCLLGVTAAPGHCLFFGGWGGGVRERVRRMRKHIEEAQHEAEEIKQTMEQSWGSSTFEPRD